MSQKYIITGTDTDIGKTVVSAMLMLGLDASYWKPVQAGVEGGVDTRTVQKLTALPPENFFEERYILSEPLSPHCSAEIDGVEIDVDALRPPAHEGTLLIEGAGGLMVPLTRKNLLVNLFKKWQEIETIPVILVARTGLGTINHTLLSLEALWSRKIPVQGIVFVGEDNPDTIKTIADISGVKVLGRLPMLDSLTSESLTDAFENNFNIDDF